MPLPELLGQLLIVALIEFFFQNFPFQTIRLEGLCILCNRIRERSFSSNVLCLRCARYQKNQTRNTRRVKGPVTAQ